MDSPEDVAHLHHRGRCVKVGCNCPEYVVFEPATRQIHNYALHSGDMCVCNHAPNVHIALHDTTTVPLSIVAAALASASNGPPRPAPLSHPPTPLVHPSATLPGPEALHIPSMPPVLSASDDASRPINVFSLPAPHVGTSRQQHSKSQMNLAHHQPPHPHLPHPVSCVVSVPRIPSRTSRGAALDVSHLTSSMAPRSFHSAPTAPSGLPYDIFISPFNPEYDMDERHTPCFSWCDEDLDVALEKLKLLWRPIWLSGDPAKGRALARCPQLFAHNFTHAELKCSYNHLRNPIRDAAFLWIAPCYAHLLGPIAPNGPQHTCFPWFVLQGSYPPGEDPHACFEDLCLMNSIPQHASPPRSPVNRPMFVEDRAPPPLVSGPPHHSPPSSPELPSVALLLTQQARGRPLMDTVNSLLTVDTHRTILPGENGISTS
ncbi:hypothetical protein NEOLEDRAFT_1182348 [Neolentinus lepideus HHB14362 ss-1]|uniref:Uncharacterized protein n=1 Tax=Neolentinus lepideus HHB14362 ss-1 TaxID=1314782 RepID=A0A165P710_9AGAM|nr:hypothetical protein NEOLEDRAFT_1182348 [Neolentinus lepideus HHB14362 ss-1]